MNILITGGAGYIGTGLVAKLAADDAVKKIVLYDNLSRPNYGVFLGGRRPGAEKIRFYKGELLDSRHLKMVLKDIDVVVRRADLRERAFGRFEGATPAEIEQRWPEDAARWRRREPDHGPGGGEALTDFYARSVAAATVLAARHPGQAIALVAHGGVLDCLYRAALRLELAAPRTWQMDNASINRLLYVGQGFSVVGWNDSTHLGMARGGPS